MLALHSLGSSSPRPSPDGSGTAGRLVEPGALRRDSGKAPPPSGRPFRPSQVGIVRLPPNLRVDALRINARSPPSLYLYKAKVGPNHPSTLTSISASGDSYKDLGPAWGLKIREETLALRKAKLGPTNRVANSPPLWERQQDHRFGTGARAS
jgi:hypothetical protein